MLQARYFLKCWILLSLWMSNNNNNNNKASCFQLQRATFGRGKISVSLSSVPRDRSSNTNVVLLNATIETNKNEPLLSQPFKKLSQSSLPIQPTSIVPPSEKQQNESLMPYIMLGLCWSAALLSALDRVAMSVAVIPLAQEMGYSDTTKGAISSLFSVGYGLAIIPAGLLIATLSPRLVMAMGVTLWSLATIATPLSAATAEHASMIPLFLARSCVGAAESVVLPTLQRLLSAWVPPERRSLAISTIFSGFHVGTITAYLVSPIIVQMGGWRGLFYVYGAVGLLWLLPWLVWAKDAPFKEPSSVEGDGFAPLYDFKSMNSIQKGEKSSWQQEAQESWRAAPWSGFVQSKGVWAMVLAHAANSWGLYNSMAWTPTFYAEQYGLDVKDSAWLSVLPSVAGAVGGIFAGTAADAIIQNLQEKSDEQITMVRKLFQGIALYGPAVMLAYLSFHIPDEPWIAQFILMGSVGMQAFNAAGFGAANQEKAGERWSGLLYSMTSLPGVMVGSLGVYVTGQILDLTQQDWSYVFGINALVNLIGATAFVCLYDSKREFD